MIYYWEYITFWRETMLVLAYLNNGGRKSLLCRRLIFCVIPLSLQNQIIYKHSLFHLKEEKNREVKGRKPLGIVRGAAPESSPRRSQQGSRSLSIVWLRYRTAFKNWMERRLKQIPLTSSSPVFSSECETCNGAIVDYYDLKQKKISSMVQWWE